jgi:prostaglandin reductase 1
MPVARKIVIAKRFQGAPKPTDFEIVEEALPETIQDGEILCKAEYLTVDPYMRGAANSVPLGSSLPGSQVARVVKSRNSEFPEGTQVVGNFGWRDLTIYKPQPGANDPTSIYRMPDMKGLPDSYALGCVGMPGNTAYFGFLRLCEPKAGDTVVVSAAAGAVGSLVGQIAKIKGCKVLGFAGEEHKLNWMKNDLGFDHVFNYKTVDLHKTFQEFAPQGIDSYFDNVGGEFTYHVMRNMNFMGRISLCGAISVYNKDPAKLPLVPLDYMSLIYKQIRMEGFMVMRWKSEWFDGLNQMRDWILEGKLNVQETVKKGFENMPQAFIELLEGKNVGKMIVKV